MGKEMLKYYLLLQICPSVEEYFIVKKIPHGTVVLTQALRIVFEDLIE